VIRAARSALVLRERECRFLRVAPEDFTSEATKTPEVIFRNPYRAGHRLSNGDD